MPFDDSQHFKTRCTSDTPVIRLAQGEQRSVDIVIRNDDGDPIDLTSYIEDEPKVENSSSSSVGDVSVRLAASHFLNSAGNLFEMNGTITDITRGEVTLKFTPTQTADNVGMMVASVGIFYGGVLRHHVLYYLEIQPTRLGPVVAGPLSTPEVRMEISDVCGAANYLLDELEFTDAEIVHAMQRAVDDFNDANPPVGGYTYNSFPWRGAWLRGTVGHLLRMASHRYRRNALRYSAGGLTVADQEKYVEYERAAREAMEEYQNWVQRKKVSINISSGYGSVGRSPYAG